MDWTFAPGFPSLVAMLYFSLITVLRKIFVQVLQTIKLTYFKRKTVFC